jgi:hypothetical protein
MEIGDTPHTSPAMPPLAILKQNFDLSRQSSTAPKELDVI